MGHDQRFKEFLHAFLQDFLKLFYPHVEKRLEFETIEFLGTEVFTDLHDGSRREADVVAKLRTRDGEPELVLIHIEIQSRPQRDVNERMFEYYSLLRARYKLPIFPVVVYLRRGKKGLVVEEYHERLFDFEILKFRYESVHLARLDAEEYLEKEAPVGAALAALMDRSKSRNVESLRVAMLWKVVESALDEARQFLLVDLIETYFRLSREQRERYQRLMSRKEYRKVQDVELTWAEELEEKGRKEGRKEGRLTGKRETLERLMIAKFGALPETTAKRVQELDSLDEIDRYLERVLVAASLAEMQLGG